MATVAKSPRLYRGTLVADSAGPFALGFRLFDTDGLEVYVNGSPKAVTTDYTVSATFADGYDDTASITFTTSLSTGDELLIYGAQVPDREDDYTPGDPNLTAMNVYYSNTHAKQAGLKPGVFYRNYNGYVMAVI